MIKGSRGEVGNTHAKHLAKPVIGPIGMEQLRTVRGEKRMRMVALMVVERAPELADNPCLKQIFAITRMVNREQIVPLLGSIEGLSRRPRPIEAAKIAASTNSAARRRSGKRPSPQSRLSPTH